nr:endogenous bornavirus-like N 1 [Miniopterus fuliginosus]
MPQTDQAPGPSHPYDQDIEEPEEEEHSHYKPNMEFNLTGKFRQYPTDDEEPQPGIGEKEDIERAAKSMFDPEHRALFHPVTASLIYLCFLFDGLYENLLSVGVKKESHLVNPVEGKIVLKVLYSTSYKGKSPKFTAPEMSSMLRHCCDLLIGVVKGSSDKVRANSFQIQKRFKTMMVCLQRPTHGDSANLLLNYNAGPAVDWINSKPWVGSLVFALLTREFESPGKEMLDQVKLVAGRSQMTTYYIIRMFLEQCTDGTLALPAIINEIILFEEKSKTVKRAVGQFFEYCGAIRHPAMLELSPRMFPNLSTAANHWAKRHNPAYSGFKAPDVTPGASITIPLLQMASLRKISRVSGNGEMDPHTLSVLKKYGVTGFQ